MQNSFPLTNGSSKDSLQFKWVKHSKRGIHRMPLCYTISAIFESIKRFYSLEFYSLAGKVNRNDYFKKIYSVEVTGVFDRLVLK